MIPSVLHHQVCPLFGSFLTAHIWPTAYQDSSPWWFAHDDSLTGVTCAPFSAKVHFSPASFVPLPLYWALIIYPLHVVHTVSSNFLGALIAFIAVSLPPTYTLFLSFSSFTLSIIVWVSFLQTSGSLTHYPLTCGSSSWPSTFLSGRLPLLILPSHLCVGLLSWPSTCLPAFLLQSSITDLTQYSRL